VIKIYHLMLRSFWYYSWRILSVLLLFYVLFFGFYNEVPRLPILNETIRNLFFHVPMWWTMMILFLVSMVSSTQYLITGKSYYDLRAVEFVNTGYAFGMAGLITGSLWAKYTWGAWWSMDPIQNGSLITLLLYLAYAILRNAITDMERRARIGAVYNIIAFFVMIPLIWIIPRVASSLHPGKGGNPGFGTYDLDNEMRLVFYPAVIGFLLLGLWMANLKFRHRKLVEHTNFLKEK